MFKDYTAVKDDASDVRLSHPTIEGQENVLTPPIADPTKLASRFTVADYKDACNLKDTNAIADALHRRFHERYIVPVMPSKNKQAHGFTIMAVSCLMIEAFESFRQGWKDSNGRSALAFCRFFDGHRQFDILRGYSSEFYTNVRCGILHQAETTGGWKITRKPSVPLFDSASLTINASRFLNTLGEVLDNYCDKLNNASWDSTEWKNCRNKFTALCATSVPR